jgi:hypothetical protein
MLKKENPKLYEINTMVWLHELFLEYGVRFSIGNVPSKEWDKLKDMGFDYVWLMGVWKRSEAGVRLLQSGPESASFKSLFNSVLPGWTAEDITGSPYSIAAYVPDAMIGVWQDIDTARQQLNKRGMGLILDFVPNHTAPDHKWIFDYPDYYIQGTKDDFKKNPSLFFTVWRKWRTCYIARGKDPYFPPWTDTAQLNFFNPELRSALMQELKKIAEHCDGVRCDMAMLVLKDIFRNNWGWAENKADPKSWEYEFWQEARRALPDFLLIAEAYWDTEWRLQQMGFDYVYDKRLYDRMRSFSAPEIYLHLTADIGFQKKLVRFIENHDEPRSAEVFRKDSLFASIVLFSTLPGLKLYHHGQLDGRRIKIPLQISGVRREEPDAEIRAFYEKILYMTKQDVFHSGSWELKNVLPVTDDSFKDLIAYVWKSDNILKLVAININQNFVQGRISLKEEISGDSELSDKSDYILYDELNNQTYVRNGKEMADPGLHVMLGWGRVHVFDISLKR